VTDTVSKTVSITPSFTLLIAWEVSNHIPPCFHLLHNLWGWKAWPLHFIIINNLQDAHGKRHRGLKMLDTHMQVPKHKMWSLTEQYQ